MRDLELPLFRHTARQSSRRESGTPIAATPISWQVLTAFLLCVFGGALIFLSTQTIVRRETAVGILSLSLGEIRVVPPRPGILTNIYVAEGDEVIEGQRLAYVSTAQYFVDGAGLEGELLTAISGERKALVRQLQALDALAPTELRAERQSLAAKRRKLGELSQLLPSIEQRVSLAGVAYEQGRTFEDAGAITGDALRQRHYDLLNHRSELQTLRAQIAELRGAIAQDEAQLIQLPDQQAKLRAEIATRLASLQQREVTTTGQQGYLVVSRVAGHVTALQARLGQYTDASRPLMAIVPSGSQLQAEVYVPSKAIGFARRGQRVRLLYEAFPYQQFGAASGTVRDISSTVLRPDEIGAPVQLKEPAYRVLVIPEKTSVYAYGVNVPLRSGMALSADLILEERSFLKLLFDPLLAAKGRIFSGE